MDTYRVQIHIPKSRTFYLWPLSYFGVAGVIWCFRMIHPETVWESTLRDAHSTGNTIASSWSHKSAQQIKLRTLELALLASLALEVMWTLTVYFLEQFRVSRLTSAMPQLDLTTNKYSKFFLIKHLKCSKTFIVTLNENEGLTKKGICVRMWIVMITAPCFSFLICSTFYIF